MDDIGGTNAVADGVATQAPSRRADARAWARRFAILTAACTVPLILFGGSVTTLGAGMAVEGWLVAEGHFMPLFPAEKWFRDLPTVVEHTHRLFGVLVGLCAIVTCVFAVRAGRARPALVGLAAVCVQGALGGFRVLENSPQLAFLHGALAQAVFALLCAVPLFLSPRRDDASEPSELSEPSENGSARRFAWVATGLVFVQIVLGAWYRHGLRTGLDEGLALRLALHFAGAFAVVLAIVALAGRLPDTSRDRRRLVHLLGLQLFLGLFAWAARSGGEVALPEWISSVLHVLVGGLLLAQCLVTALRLRRAAGSERTLAASLGGFA